MSGGSAVSLVASLDEQARRTVEGAISPGSRCALLGYPNHTNPGDHAVWLGAKSILARLGCEIVYECSWRDYSRDALAVAVEDGAMIVFTGGGNFGDLWPATHELRERVLRDFRGVRVVQLQQSVNFKRDATLARTRTLLERHGNVALLVRDLPSLELARHAFGVNVSLGPDLAFACPIVDVTRSAPTVDVLWIARQDRESRRLGPRRAPAGVGRIDWNLP